MPLYVRVFNSFWNHRKTARLRSRIGDDAFWVPPRLWAYASDNQPDGDFGKYTDEEIAMLITYLKDAPSMVLALMDCGFMDSNRKLHDWHEHNAYHFTFAERSKKALAARWGDVEPATPEAKEKKAEEKKRKEQAILEHALSIIPEKLNTEEFKKAFREWIEFRMKLKKSKDFKKLFERNLEQLAEWGERDAIQSIRNALNGEWQGLHPVKTSANPKAGSAGIGINSIAQADSVLEEIRKEIQRIVDNSNNYNSLDVPPFRQMKPEASEQINQLKKRRDEIRKVKMGFGK